MIESEYRENQLAVFLTEVHHPATRGLVECAGTNDGRFVNCKRHQQIVQKVGHGYLTDSPGNTSSYSNRVDTYPWSENL
jgi:hypothetical protein